MHIEDRKNMVAALARNAEIQEQPLYYEAAAEVVKSGAQSISRYLGSPSASKAFIVSKKTGMPGTKYPNEFLTDLPKGYYNDPLGPNEIMAWLAQLGNIDPRKDFQCLRDRVEEWKSECEGE